MMMLIYSGWPLWGRKNTLLEIATPHWIRCYRYVLVSVFPNHEALQPLHTILFHWSLWTLKGAMWVPEIQWKLLLCSCSPT